MKKTINLILGLFLTIVIFGLGVLATHLIKLENNFFPNSLVTHSTMLALSVIAIFYFNKFDFFIFPFKKVKLKYYFYGILISLLGFIIAQVLATVFLNIFGLPMTTNGKAHPLMAELNPLQIFLFIFIYASICEEFLYRGLAQNFFKPLQEIGIRINKNVFISLPVLLCGVLFSMSHLILLTTNTGLITLINVLIMTWIIGTIAGYFQEKHQNILPAIVIHMTANLPGLIISLFM